MNVLHMVSRLNSRQILLEMEWHQNVFVYRLHCMSLLGQKISIETNKFQILNKISFYISGAWSSSSSYKNPKNNTGFQQDMSL